LEGTPAISNRRMLGYVRSVALITALAHYTFLHHRGVVVISVVMISIVVISVVVISVVVISVVVISIVVI